MKIHRKDYLPFYVSIWLIISMLITSSPTVVGGLSPARDVTDVSPTFNGLEDGLNTCEDLTGCIPGPPGMISWWSANGHTLDLVGDNDGVLQGDSGYTDGMVGKALSFDGVDDFVRVSDSSSLQAITTAFSIEAWAKPSALPVGDEYYDSSIVVREDYGEGFALVTKGNAFGLWIGNDVPNGIIATSDPVTTGSWYHVVGTYDGSNARIYINGILEGTQPVTIINRNLDLTIGSSRGEGRFFNGLIDEVTIYNRPLAAEEIMGIYSAGSGGKCKGCNGAPADLVARWAFNESSGTVTDDLVGSNYGSIYGATWSDGKYGSALSFDGVNDDVHIQKAALWDFGTGSFTVSAWFKSSSGGGYMAIIRYDSGYLPSGGWYVGFYPGNHVEFVVLGPDRTGYQVLTDNTYTDNLWHFVSGVRDGASGKLRIYIDGIPAGAEGSDGGSNIIGAGDASQLIIGAGAWGGQYFMGLIDEITIFDRALSAEEISAIYADGNTGLCGYWINLPLLMR